MWYMWWPNVNGTGFFSEYFVLNYLDLSLNWYSYITDAIHSLQLKALINNAVTNIGPVDVVNKSQYFWSWVIDSVEWSVSWFSHCHGVERGWLSWYGCGSGKPSGSWCLVLQLVTCRNVEHGEEEKWHCASTELKRIRNEEIFKEIRIYLVNRQKILLQTSEKC
jgi:hypothetical protein